MSIITQNLPWFIKDLGVSIIGEECYESLVENLHITDVKCLKYSLSKGLGIGIVVGGSIMKVPQVLLIINAHSARGLSLPAYTLETLAYGITLAYSFRNQFPFSTYGENLFLTLQNILITLLIIFYAPPGLSSSRANAKQQKLLIAISLTLISTVGLLIMPDSALAFAQLATLPLSLFSKLPQIQQNHRSRSTGQLSAFAVISQIAGCLARLFTTATEVGDSLISAGFALALALNVVLGAQLWLYWGEEPQEKDEFGLRSSGSGYEEGKGKAPAYQPAAWESHIQTAVYPSKPSISYTPPTPTTNQRATTPPAGGKKWARKLD